MIVQDDANGDFGRIVCIDFLQKGYELATAMSVVHLGNDMTIMQIQCLRESTTSLSVCIRSLSSPWSASPA